jgi:hypothetical protein
MIVPLGRWGIIVAKGQIATINYKQDYLKKN